MIRALSSVRPRIIAAAVNTQRIADAAASGAGSTGVQVCTDESQLDYCLASYWAPVIVAELGTGAPMSMLGRLIRGTDQPIIAVLPQGALPISQILSLALSGARFELVHDVSEVAAATAQAMSSPAVDSEIGELTRALAWRLDRRTLEYVVGMLVLGRRRIESPVALERLIGSNASRTAARERPIFEPSRLLGWGAAFHLVWQMEYYASDFPAASARIGFETPLACSDAFKSHTGSAPMNVLRGPGFAGLLDEFVRRLGETNDVFTLGARTESILA
jgi:hypothetical protein